MKEIEKTTILKAAAGDMTAFEEIYRTASGFVYTTALAVTRNTADAEEVTQDVFLKIYAHLKGFRFQSSLKTWIYRITMNTALNVCRKNSEERGRRADYDLALKTQPAPDTATVRLEQDEIRDALGSLLDNLNPDQRACIVLREIEGLSYQEIAESLEVNINTVRTRLKRAREALLKARQRGVNKDEL